MCLSTLKYVQAVQAERHSVGISCKILIKSHYSSSIKFLPHGSRRAYVPARTACNMHVHE